VATFASDPEGSKAATIKFLTDSFSPAIQAACDKARSTHRKSLNPLNAKTAVEQRNLSEFIAYLGILLPENYIYIRIINESKLLSFFDCLP